MKPTLQAGLLLAAALLAGTGCGTYFRVPVKPPTGAIFTSISAPLTTNFNRSPVGTKQGSASTHFFRVPLLTGFDFAWGRAGIADAARAGNISDVSYADYQYTMIFGIFGTFTVNAHGL